METPDWQEVGNTAILPAMQPILNLNDVLERDAVATRALVVVVVPRQNMDVLRAIHH